MTSVAAVAMTALTFRHATTVGLLAGPLVVVGYLAGSVPFAYLISRRRLRRQLDDPGLARLPAAGAGSGSGHGYGVRQAAGGGLLAAAATLAATTLAWELTSSATPGAGNFSAGAVFSNQAIGACVSVSLWTGMAAVVGHVAPAWTGFRGGTGLPPAIALLVVYTPLVLLAGAGTFLVAYGVRRRPRSSVLLSLPVMVVFAYVAWLADLQAGWGVINGPEVTLWTTALAGILFARNLRASWGAAEPG